MIKGSKYKNLGRLKDALISNASLNNIDAFKENYASWILNDQKGRPSVFGVADSNKDKLMDFAMKNLSKDVVEFLLKEGASCNFASCIYECKYEMIEYVYNYIIEMIDKHGPFTKNTHLHKSMVINRLIDPEKVLANKDRLAHTIELIRKGFLSADEVREIANALYTSDRSKGQFKMLSRELVLTELGI